jgi:hypothetical protein
VQARRHKELKMKRSSRRISASPFAIWTSLAFRTGEMMMASAQVIGHRTNRMIASGPMPNESDRREFSLMGQEKMEATSESVQAMAKHMMTLNQQIGAQAVGHMLAGATDMLSLATSQTAGQALARQAQLIRTLTRGAVSASQLSTSAARLAQRGLKPIHSRATANAKRLGK